LNVNNPVEVFVLQFVFLPRINLALHEFRSASNSRPVRTEHNWSPLRLWINGMLNRHSRDASLNEPFLDDLVYYGSDPEGPSPLEEHGTVEVDDVLNPLSQPSYEVFQQLVDPLAESDSFGIDIYLQARDTCQNLLV